MDGGHLGAEIFLGWREGGNSSSVFILSLDHKLLTACVRTDQVGDIVLKYIYIYFFFQNWSLYASLFYLVLADMNVKKKKKKESKRKKKKKRKGKNVEDPIKSKSETYQFHKFLKPIKVWSGGSDLSAKIRAGDEELSPF